MSCDPTYREKLSKITSTLSHLSSDEKFFSIDEFGPFSIRIHGGTALVPSDQIRTIPQRQRSRGSLICTAALELSSNQILHFYSKRKNSKEMIKLVRRLIICYRGQERIFVSWDSASWHASKLLYKRVDEINSDEFRWRHKTPNVELIPLPSGAQFLNVIESVFSGMARAILHNSNYRNVAECKAAINMYFADRNRAFLERPRRAGNKIWGKERVEAVFKEENNCKDMVGRRFGLPLLREHGRYIHLDENRLLIGHYLFFRYGSAVVFFGRFIAMLRMFAALLAGANGMPAGRFFFFNITGG